MALLSRVLAFCKILYYLFIPWPDKLCYKQPFRMQSWYNADYRSIMLYYVIVKLYLNNLGLWWLGCSERSLEIKLGLQP